MNLLAFLALGVLAASLLASLALYITLRADQDPKALRRAFEALEEEFEDQRDHVRQALGRISRLKRSVQDGIVPASVGTETASQPPDSGPLIQEATAGPFRLTERQKAIQSAIVARRRGGVQ